jgi:transmembrane sensor
MDFERRLNEGPLRVAPLWSAEHTERLPGRVLAERRRRAVVRGVASLGAGLSLVAGLWFFSPKSPEVAANAPALASAAPSAAERDFALADGSHVSLLAAGSRVEVLEQSAARVRTQLGAGSARFDVRHDPARVFEVESGDVKVRVLGTAFSLVREGALTRVAVERGAVRVEWSGGQAFLSAGQSGLYPPPAGEADAVKPPEAAAELGSNVGEEAASWRKLAKRGAYADAFKALGPSSKGVLNEPSDLMLAADVARLSRHPGEATRFLSRVTDQFPRDKQAPLAAFTLGRVLLEDLGQPGRAADAFHRAQQLAPKGPLASDALAREADAAQRAGQVDRAKQLAQRYLESYPTGPHAARLRKL